VASGADSSIMAHYSFTQSLTSALARTTRNRQLAVHCSLLIHNCSFVIWAHPRASAGSGFPLQFLSLPAVGLRDFRFNPLRGFLVRLSPIPSRRRGKKPLAAPFFVIAKRLSNSRHCEWLPHLRSRRHGGRTMAREPKPLPAYALKRSSREASMSLDCFGAQCLAMTTPRTPRNSRIDIIPHYSFTPQPLAI
jgi:hypothetical protein